MIPEAAGLRDHSSAPRAPLAGPWVAWVDAAAMTVPGRVVPVDLQEKRQLDLARQVAKVKDHARPWRAIIALVLAVAAAIVSFTAGDITSEQPLERVIAIARGAYVRPARGHRGDRLRQQVTRRHAARHRPGARGGRAPHDRAAGEHRRALHHPGTARCPDRPAPGRRRGDVDHPRHRRPAVARQCVLRPGPAAVPLYRFRTRCRVRELRFGRIGGLGQDRGSCLSACCT